MIKIEKVDVHGWEAAIRGMRNPKNSWEKSDTIWGELRDEGLVNYDIPQIGKSDLTLMRNLSTAGNDHGKFLRMITVTCDITAPLYWWKEADQYKVGTVTDSCSTMHKIHANEFTMDDFSIEHLDEWSLACMEKIISVLNDNRKEFNNTKDKTYWWQMIQLLPSSYNQKRTWLCNYQVLKNIYFARKNHKLDEWHTLCDWIESLPYFKEICLDE